MTLKIHDDIKRQLNNFLKEKDIPNIIFHGPSGDGKHTIVQDFINNIYDYNKAIIKTYVLNVNCAHGKGIQFIREDLKFFAKAHINIHKGKLFKSIVLSNADKLTIDGQSAMRRSIELFSHNTRFFIIVEDKYKLLMPILSRFCEIYIPLPIIKNKLKKQNLHQYKINRLFTDNNKKKRCTWLKQTLANSKIDNYEDLLILTNKLYNKGCSGLDLMNYIDKQKHENYFLKYKLLVILHKMKREYRNEKLYMIYILSYLFLRSDIDLENITFM
jgi:DNA polymerase III delta prime subunit